MYITVCLNMSCSIALGFSKELLGTSCLVEPGNPSYSTVSLVPPISTMDVYRAIT